eukprot:5888443-Karenia_brevis.AAC.1
MSAVPGKSRAVLYTNLQLGLDSPSTPACLCQAAGLGRNIRSSCRFRMRGIAPGHSGTGGNSSM